MSNKIILEKLERPVQNIDFIKEHKYEIENFLYNLGIEDVENVYNAIYGISKFIMKNPDYVNLEMGFGRKLIKMLNKISLTSEFIGEYGITLNVLRPGMESIINKIGLDIDLRQFEEVQQIGSSKSETNLFERSALKGVFF
jgi:hypothetical protein